MQFYLPLLFAAVIAITYYSINRLHDNCSKYHFEIISLSAGVSITYVLLELFPNFTEAALSVNRLWFIPVLIGFSAHHLIEKEIYQHKHKNKLVRSLSLQEEAFSFVDQIALGLVLVSLSKENIMKGLLAFLPILTFTVVSALNSKHSNNIKAVFTSSATVIGVILVLAFGAVPAWLQLSLMGLATGLLLFTTIRHHLPFGREGRPAYFALGAILYSLFIIAIGYI